MEQHRDPEGACQETHVSFVDEVVRRLSGANLRERDEEAEAALLRSIDDTHLEGGLDERSAALLGNVVEFSSTDVGEVMTPRTDIDGIEMTDDLASIRSFNRWWEDRKRERSAKKREGKKK